MSDGNSTERIHSLDSMRFIAATVVYFSHAQPISQVDRLLGVVNWDPINAKSAVAFFFVLSGFVLQFGLRGEAQTLAGTTRFLVRRCFRIYPLYYFSLLLCFVLTQLPLGAVPNLTSYEVSGRVLSSSHSDLIQWIHHILLISPGLNFDYLNPPIWTLAAEMRIAFILPALSLVVVRLSFINGAICVVGAFLIAPKLAAVSIPTVSVIPLFLAGLWAAEHLAVFSRVGRFWERGFLVIGFGIYFVSPSLGQLLDGGITSHMYLSGLGSILIMVYLDKVGMVAGLARAIIPRWLSDASYGLYVLHFPVLMGVAYLFWRMEISFNFFVATAYIVCVGISILVYRVIEAPMIRVGRKFTFRCS